jgi:hypothetical protein
LWRHFLSFACISLQPAIDPGYLFHPALPLAMLKIHHGIPRPVEVIGNIGYLLMQAV